jgi:hypothetical protein
MKKTPAENHSQPQRPYNPLEKRRLKYFTMSPEFLDNPHPLSQVKTELIWEGKYDEYGNRRTVDIAGCAMPLQKIETIDEPRSRCMAMGDLFNSKKAHPDDFRNMLIWGDNKLVMASLLKDFRGKTDKEGDPCRTHQ